MPPIHDDYPPIPQFPTAPTILCTNQIKLVLPRPSITVRKAGVGILELEWKMDDYNSKIHRKIAGYKIWAVRTNDSYPNTSWENVGCVQSNSYHMVCILDSVKYLGMLYLTIVAVDEYGNWSEFSNIQEILVTGIEGGHLNNIRSLRRYRYFNVP